MPDEIEPTDDATQTGTEITTPDTGSEAAAGGDNPAWEPIRSALDETTYGIIKPHLSNFDKETQRRIESLNREFEWAGKLTKGDGAVTPEEIGQAVGFAKQLRENPLWVFNNLRGFLEQEYPDDYAKIDWILREQAAQQQPAGGDGDEPDPDDDPRFAELKRQQDELAAGQEQQRLFLEQQEQQRLYNEASAQIDADVRRVQSARSDLQKEDWKEILGYAGRQTEITGKPVTVDEAVEWFDSIANRIRTAPRPGDSAPQLLPLGGGNPGGIQKPEISKMSDSDIEAMIAADMDAKRKQG